MAWHKMAECPHRLTQNGRVTHTLTKNGGVTPQPNTKWRSSLRPWQNGGVTPCPDTKLCSDPQTDTKWWSSLRPDTKWWSDPMPWHKMVQNGGVGHGLLQSRAHFWQSGKCKVGIPYQELLPAGLSRALLLLGTHCIIPWAVTQMSSHCSGSCRSNSPQSATSLNSVWQLAQPGQRGNFGDADRYVFFHARQKTNSNNQNLKSGKFSVSLYFWVQ